MFPLEESIQELMTFALPMEGLNLLSVLGHEIYMVCKC